MAKTSGPQIAPVGDYPERPYDEAKADPEVLAKIEDRNRPDQIKVEHPENKVDAPENEADLVLTLLAQQKDSKPAAEQSK